MNKALIPALGLILIIASAATASAASQIDFSGTCGTPCYDKSKNQRVLPRKIDSFVSVNRLRLEISTDSIVAYPLYHLEINPDSINLYLRHRLGINLVSRLADWKPGSYRLDDWGHAYWRVRVHGYARFGPVDYFDDHSLDDSFDWAGVDLALPAGNFGFSSQAEEEVARSCLRDKWADQCVGLAEGWTVTTT